MKDIINDLAEKFGIPYAKMEIYVQAMVDHVEKEKPLDEKIAAEMDEALKVAIMNEITLFPIP